MYVCVCMNVNTYVCVYIHGCTPRCVCAHPRRLGAQTKKKSRSQAILKCCFLPLTCTPSCTYILTYKCTPSCTYTHVQVYSLVTYTHIQDSYTRKCTQTLTLARTNARTHTCTHTHTHTCTHAHMHARTYVRTHVRMHACTHTHTISQAANLLLKGCTGAAFTVIYVRLCVGGGEGGWGGRHMFV